MEFSLWSCPVGVHLQTSLDDIPFADLSNGCQFTELLTGNDACAASNGFLLRALCVVRIPCGYLK